ncbi:MAG: hypothetical protein WCA46_06955, partial [Actinocatenispora sp.]
MITPTGPDRAAPDRTVHRRRLPLLAAAGVAALAMTTLAPTATAAPAPAQAPTGAATATAWPTPVLPRPTGPHRIGTTALHLVDRDRADPWVPARPRELMVSLWYPAVPRTGHGPVRYVTARESTLILRSQHVTGVPPHILSRVRTHARGGALPLPGRRALVLLSPGFSLPRTSMTMLAEELASRGYLVAAIEHTYESVATTFPDGRVTTCVACESADPKAVIAGRVRDVSFVLDRLTGSDPGRRGRAADPVARWRQWVDASRTAIVGHSIGGASAVVLPGTDRRVDAAVNLDGTMFADVPAAGRSAPVLLFGSNAAHLPGEDDTWDATWPRFEGWKRWLAMAGATHFSFIDYQLLAEQLGVPAPPGTVPGDRAWRITRHYV